MRSPVVEIDAGSGFCHGVVSAIRKAEEELARPGKLACLGDIVHNSDEVERLRQKGLDTITHDDLSRMSHCKVLLRAHGEPPSTYKTARERDIEIVDATCPVVLQLQRRIKKTFDTALRTTQIVMYGKNGHAEVNGLVGQTEGTAIVVEDIAGLGAVDFSRDIELYSQTTKSVEGFREIIDEINRRRDPRCRFHFYDTICRQVANRVGHLREFAAAHDVILFVSGAKSSNGRVLFGHCLQVNPDTHLISNASEVDPAWLEGKDSIGICGATSTPRWLMDQIGNLIIESLKK